MTLMLYELDYRYKWTQIENHLQLPQVLQHLVQTYLQKPQYNHRPAQTIIGDFFTQSLCRLQNAHVLSRSDHSLKIWDLESGHCQRTLPIAEPEKFCSCTQLTNGQVITGSSLGVLSLWDLASGRCLKSSKWYRKSIDVVRELTDG